MITYLRINPNNQVLLDKVAEDVFDVPVDPERRELCVSGQDRVQLVAVSDGVVVGQLLAVIHRHVDKGAELYVDDLGVAPGGHRQGIATRLMSKAQGIAQAGGVSEVWVAVDPENVGAREFYASMGMKPRPAVVFEMPIRPNSF